MFDRAVPSYLVGLVGILLVVTPLKGAQSTAVRYREAGRVLDTGAGRERGIIKTVDQNGTSPALMVFTLLMPLHPQVAVESTSVVYSGAPIAGGTFTGGTTLGIPIGVILSSGNIASVEGGTLATGQWNEFDWITTTNSPWGGDPDVAAITRCKSGTVDKAVLEFNITSTVKTRILKFVYVFGSEEYNEWATSASNDGFGIWINQNGSSTKTNVALIPVLGFASAGLRPVTVRNVNRGVQGWDATKPNSAFYVNNDCDDQAGPGTGPGYKCGPPVITELDGLTAVQGTRPCKLAADVKYHVKIAIADGNDRYNDADVFVKGTVGGSCYRCEPVFSCVDAVREAECYDGYWSESELCIERPSPCSDSTGACCLADESCTSTTAASCYAGGGVYAGNGTSCSTTGACCLDYGYCLTMTQDCCTEAEGAYQGNGSTCSPTGACHIGSSCTTSTADCCPGSYQGNGSTCDIGACCKSDGSCLTTTESDCDGQSGVYLGDDTDCAGDNDDVAGDDVCQDRTPPQACGNDITEGEEECDGSDNIACVDACRSDCTCPSSCGNNVREGNEECDGSDDEACPGRCGPDCLCPGIPTLSEWGMLVMTLLLLAAGTVVFVRRRGAVTEA